MRSVRRQLQEVTTPSPSPHEEERRRAGQIDALAMLGASLYAEALHLCDDEEEAAAHASAAMVKWLEEQSEIARAQRPRGSC